MGAIESPRLTAAPGSYGVTWTFSDLEAVFQADRLRSHSDGRLQARVRVLAKMLPGGEELVLHHGMLNLARRSRRDLSPDLTDRLPRESVNGTR